MLDKLGKGRWFCLLIALMLLATACAGSGAEVVEGVRHEVAEHTATHWSYEGEGGPENWGTINNGEHAVCGNGEEQSPIDITAAAGQDLANIIFHYQPSKVNILNNGHTVQVDYDT